RTPSVGRQPRSLPRAPTPEPPVTVDHPDAALLPLPLCGAGVVLRGARAALLGTGVSGKQKPLATPSSLPLEPKQKPRSASIAAPEFDLSASLAWVGFLAFGTQQGYGLTESCGIILLETPGNNAHKFGSSGLEAKVISLSTLKPLPPNQLGELCFCGLNIMQGQL
ncbi:hypothetical protein Taro_006252, partial [Colocasia esculenta]|nr:hypothetical protein [Colocasia esculenta]